ncbi:hypothetical protein [Variovorax terrae]|uniref:Uncharacterized protein n=1 Tax=Variovorax terrae TaxID=2923278 RepID=A0A9X2ANW2_9BURK|nr:hypothetical protein [Variovorax terrae]MCJ0764809.1 hypothetical protein [Variovorax terrae]
MAASLLTPEFIALISQGVTTIVCSRDQANRPSVMRAVGSTITPEGRTITVYLTRRSSRQLVQDIAATGSAAVVFSVPFTHRTVQVKTERARIREASPDDEPLLARYLQAMEQEVLRVGYPPSLTRAMLSHRIEDVVAVSFEPLQAFDQTPGPRAGAALGEEGAA